MIWLSGVGLLLDLLGVILLGIDLLNVQKSQKESALRDQETLTAAFPKFYSLDLEKTYLESGDSDSEGFYGNGGLDADGLDRTLKAFRAEIDKTQSGVVDITEYLFATVGEKATESKRSLAFTQFGLALIIVGFGLQLAGLLAPSIMGLGDN